MATRLALPKTFVRTFMPTWVMISTISASLYPASRISVS